MAIANVLSSIFSNEQVRLFCFEFTCWLALLTVIFYGFEKWKEGPFYTKTNRVDDQVVIITGCNTGIGKETALEMAKRGARVYMACRNYDKCEQARKEIIKLSGNNNVFNRTLDLASLKSVREFAAKFLEEEQRLDILINNAGIANIHRTLTEDGFEQQFSANHLGPFLLTNLLLDVMKSSPHSRIVVVTSYIYIFGKFDKNDINLEKGFTAFGAYTRSKLANILFTRKLAHILQDTNIVVNCLHPGSVQTEILRYDPFINFLHSILFKYFFRSAKAGAQTVLYLALDPDMASKTGGYYDRMRRYPLLPKARNKQMADWLWEKSEKMVGLKELQTNATF